MKEDLEKDTVREKMPGSPLVLEDSREGRTEVPEEGYACGTGKGYFAIQETEGGYDYTFYDKDYKALDGGVYENPDVSIWEAAEDILADEGIPAGERAAVGYGWPMERTGRAGQAGIRQLPPISDNTGSEKALNGQSRAGIEETALCYAQAQLEDAGLDGEVELLAARVYGSRTREGLYREGSDIDVAISYIGNIREDAFFDILNEGGLKIAGLPVDMNPVSMEETGTLEKYLESAERYLDSKEAQMKGAKIAAENTGGKEDGPAVGARERRSVLAALKERQESMERRGNMADNSKGYRRRGQEL